MFSLIYSIVYLVFLLAAFHTTVIVLSVELESLVLGVILISVGFLGGETIASECFESLLLLVSSLPI